MQCSFVFLSDRWLLELSDLLCPYSKVPHFNAFGKHVTLITLHVHDRMACITVMQDPAPSAWPMNFCPLLSSNTSWLGYLTFQYAVLTKCYNSKYCPKFKLLCPVIEYFTPFYINYDHTLNCNIIFLKVNMLPLKTGNVNIWLGFPWPWAGQILNIPHSPFEIHSICAMGWDSGCLRTVWSRCWSFIVLPWLFIYMLTIA